MISSLKLLFMLFSYIFILVMLALKYSSEAKVYLVFSSAKSMSQQSNPINLKNSFGVRWDLTWDLFPSEHTSVLNITIFLNLSFKCQKQIVRMTVLFS